MSYQRVAPHNFRGMTRMVSPCVLCAEAGTSCCVNKQIVLTNGDVERLKAAGCDDVVVYEEPDRDYALCINEPEWQYLSRRLDGLRQVLRRKANGECHLLTIPMITAVR